MSDAAPANDLPESNGTVEQSTAYNGETEERTSKYILNKHNVSYIPANWQQIRILWLNSGDLSFIVELVHAYGIKKNRYTETAGGKKKKRELVQANVIN